MDPTQGRILRQEARGARSYLEIGVQEGDSLAEVIVGAADTLARIVLCDTWGIVEGGTNRGSHDHILHRFAPWADRFEFLDGDSKMLIPTLRGQTFDLIHVDGDHAQEAELADLMNVWPLCGKTVVVHDANYPTVASAIEAFLALLHRSGQVRYDIVYHVGDLGTVVIRKQADGCLS